MGTQYSVNPQLSPCSVEPGYCLGSGGGGRNIIDNRITLVKCNAEALEQLEALISIGLKFRETLNQTVDTMSLFQLKKGQNYTICLGER